MVRFRERVLNRCLLLPFSLVQLLQESYLSGDAIETNNQEQNFLNKDIRRELFPHEHLEIGLLPSDDVF